MLKVRIQDKDQNATVGVGGNGIYFNVIDEEGRKAHLLTILIHESRGDLIEMARLILRVLEVDD